MLILFPRCISSSSISSIVTAVAPAAVVVVVVVVMFAGNAFERLRSQVGDLLKVIRRVHDNEHNRHVLR